MKSREHALVSRGEFGIAPECLSSQLQSISYILTNAQITEKLDMCFLLLCLLNYMHSYFQNYS